MITMARRLCVLLIPGILVATMLVRAGAESPAAGQSLTTAASEISTVVRLTSDRLAVAERVALIKWFSGGAVHDEARAAAVRHQMQDAAATRHLNSAFVGAVSGDQIAAAEAAEYTLLA